MERKTNIEAITAAKKAAREDEIRNHGKLISFRTVIETDRKRYDRKRLKGSRNEKGGGLYNE